MKKRTFYGWPAKIIVAVILIVAAIVGSIGGTWFLKGQQMGETFSEIAENTPYENTGASAESLNEKVGSILEGFEYRNIFETNGYYVKKATVDIMHIQDGVPYADKKNATTYYLSDLASFYGTDEYNDLSDLVSEYYDGDTGFRSRLEQIDTGSIFPLNGKLLYKNTDSAKEAYQAYDDLLFACNTLNTYIESSEASNVKVYIKNMETGEVLTNDASYDDSDFSELLSAYQKKTKNTGMLYYAYDGNDGKEYISDNQAGRKMASEYNKEASSVKALFKNIESDSDLQIFFGLDTTYSVNDGFQAESHYYNAYLKQNPQLCSILMLICLAIVGITLILMGVQAGRRKEDTDIHLVPMDKFPIEIMIVMDLCLWGTLAAGIFSLLGSGTLYVEPEQYAYYDFNGLWEFCFANAALFTCLAILMAWEVKRYVRRIKGRTIGGSLIGAVVKGVRDLTGTIYRGQSYGKRLTILYFLFLLLNLFSLILTAVTMPAGIIIFILLLLGDAVVLQKILKNCGSREVIKKGMSELASGNLGYQIDTAKLSGDNLEMAESLNHVRDGLENAVQTAMKSERMKTDLITNVSHDIKTPLTSIINYVDLLKREQISNPTITKYIDILDRKSQRLKQLTEDLVEASKISSGNITLDMQKIDLRQLILQENGEFEEKFQNRDLQLVFQLADEPLMILADGRRMYRVIDNLYNNAAKYALSNTRIYVTAEKSEEKDEVLFSIKNISESPLNINADELMERFVRGDVSRSTEGSGLGLEIARNLTVMQKGKFDIYLDGDLFKVTLTFPSYSE